MLLRWSAFWMTIFLFLDKCLKVLNWDAVNFSDGLRSLVKLCYEDKPVSSNLAFIKGKSSLHRFSCFTSRNSNSKGSKNSEYSEYDFLKFDWCKMLNGYADFSFNIFSLRITSYQSKRWKIEDDLNKTWITSNSCVF